MTPENVARVLDEARAWIGTPYHHAADKKGVGVDCAMLPVRVYCDLGIVPMFDPRPYPTTGCCTAPTSAISAGWSNSPSVLTTRSPATLRCIGSAAVSPMA